MNKTDLGNLYKTDIIKIPAIVSIKCHFYFFYIFFVLIYLPALLFASFSPQIFIYVLYAQVDINFCNTLTLGTGTGKQFCFFCRTRIGWTKPRSTTSSKLTSRSSARRPIPNLPSATASSSATLRTCSTARSRSSGATWSTSRAFRGCSKTSCTTTSGFTASSTSTRPAWRCTMTFTSEWGTCITGCWIVKSQR